MNKTMHFALFIIAILVSSCSSGALFAPRETITPTVTMTPLPTTTPTITVTLTPKPTDTPTPIPLGLVKGRVFIEDLDRPYLTDVHLVDTETEKRVSVSNDDDGYFVFEEVQPGNYQLQIDPIMLIPEDELFTYCNQLQVDQASWNYSMSMAIVGEQLQVTDIIFYSDPFDVVGGDTVDNSLLLYCSK